MKPHHHHQHFSPPRGLTRQVFSEGIRARRKFCLELSFFTFKKHKQTSFYENNNNTKTSRNFQEMFKRFVLEDILEKSIYILSLIKK